MGIFQSKEEKAEEKRAEEKRALELRIANSPMTQVIKNVLLEKYGSLDSKEVEKLRRARKGSCQLHVERDGFAITLNNAVGENIDGWGMSFDAMDYEDLSKTEVEILRKIMIDTLSEIPHLTVLDSGYIAYNTDRPKKAW